MATTTSSRSSTRSSSANKSSGGASKSRSRGGRSSSRSNGPGGGETDRYRRAAEDALQQLDWVIGYLHGIKKTQISRALAQNRSYIRRHLMGEADAGLPTQDTDQT